MIRSDDNLTLGVGLILCMQKREAGQEIQKQQQQRSQDVRVVGPPGAPEAIHQLRQGRADIPFQWFVKFISWVFH